MFGDPWITSLQIGSQRGRKKNPVSEVSRLARNKEFRERSDRVAESVREAWERVPNGEGSHAPPSSPGPLSVRPARPRPHSASSPGACSQVAGLLSL